MDNLQTFTPSPSNLFSVSLLHTLSPSLDFLEFPFHLHFFDGLFHGMVYSFPFSVPILLCIARTKQQGLKTGLIATLATVLGQISFMMVSSSFPSNSAINTRWVFYVWYTLEPLLAILGFVLCFRLATNVLVGLPTSANLVGSRAGFDGMKPKSIFLFHFLLPFLNPAFSASSTRILLATDSFSGYPLIYFAGFFFISFFSIGFIWPSFFSALGTVVSSGVAFFQKLLKIEKSDFSMPSNSQAILSFLIVGCLLSGITQYSWRLFTQYPAELLFSGTSVEFKREFPSFDSNIRQREKNLPLDRFLPIEKMNNRRILSGRPKLTEEQKSDAYFKFHSFFINGIEQFVDLQSISLRENQKKDIFHQIELQTALKNIEFSDENAPVEVSKQMGGGNTLTKGGERQLRQANPSPRNLQNNTKGNPPRGFAYVWPEVEKEAASKNLYFHDDLRLYELLFKNSALK